MIVPWSQTHLLDLHDFSVSARNLLAPAGEVTISGENLRLRRLLDVDPLGAQLLQMRRAVLPIVRVRPPGGALLRALLGVRS
jgi:hypothetical protein